MEGRSDTRVQSIDIATLTPLVRQVVASETVEVTSWDSQQIHGGFGYGSAGGSAIHRFSGQGRDQQRALEWSLILKVLHPPADRGQPSDFNYWRREAHAFESGLLDDLPGGLAAPRCFGVVKYPDGECWIWMEDVADDIGSAEGIGEEWPLEHYGTVARHLGQFNGAYLTGRPIPSRCWLRRTAWLRERVARAGPAIRRLSDSLGHPLVRRAYPPDAVDSVLRRWAEREEFLAALDRLPQTLCHGDACRRNLFAQGTQGGLEQTVAVDWAVVGMGWIGMEIRALIGSTLELLEVHLSDAQALDAIVFAGYLDGLRDAGWHGDPRQVRLAVSAELALDDLGTLPSAIAILVDERLHASFEQTMGLPVAQYADFWAERTGRLPLKWEAEARELLGSL